MGGLGKKKEQRRVKKAEKKAAKESSSNVVVLEKDEWFDVVKKEALDNNPMGFFMDALLKNTVRMTTQVWTRGFGGLPLLLGKNLLFLQLLIVDEDRNIQGKLYGIGRDVEPEHVDVIRRSRRIFKEAAPFLLRHANSWVFSRSLAHIGFNGNVDEAMKFSEYDPLGNRLEPGMEEPNSTRCAEVFLFAAGDFEVKDTGVCCREAVKELLKELYADDDVLKLKGFFVVAASANVTKKKLDELKDVHLVA